MLYYELFHTLAHYFSLLASIISILMLSYFILKARSTRPYAVLAAGSAGLIIGRKLRNVVIFTFTGILILFLAYVEKYYIGVSPIYWALEALSMLILLLAAVLAVTL
ncbi:MAG: hypothetical protein M1503_02010 [Thaumarchaeota archaeon]|nr:hypothetical protein [Nitrososphaerota archaeon]MCL5317026.1 hypothetical protein [Nitrososphaerota archaeon]